MTWAALEDYLPFIERHLQAKVKIHRSDQGGEFLGDHYAKGLQQRGIKYEMTVRETPQQNGVVERINRTIEDRARATMVASHLPSKLWDEVWNAMVYLYNRTPHTYLDGGIPYLSSTGATEKINVDYLRVIWRTAHSHIPKNQRADKHGLTAKKLIIVGYSQTSKAYRLWNPQTDSVVERFNVTIDENKPYKPDEVEGIDVFSGPGMVPVSRSIEKIFTYQYLQGGALHFKVLWKDNITTWEDPTVFVQQPEMLREYCLRHNLPDPNLQIDLQIENSDDSPSEAVTALFAAGVGQELSSYQEAIRTSEAQQWLAAMQTEIDTLRSFPAWQLVPRPTNRYGRKNVASEKR